MLWRKFGNRLFRSFGKKKSGVRKFGPDVPMRELQFSNSVYENKGEYPRVEEDM